MGGGGHNGTSVRAWPLRKITFFEDLRKILKKFAASLIINLYIKLYLPGIPEAGRVQSIFTPE